MSSLPSAEIIGISYHISLHMNIHEENYQHFNLIHSTLDSLSLPYILCSWLTWSTCILCSWFHSILHTLDSHSLPYILLIHLVYPIYTTLDSLFTWSPLYTLLLINLVYPIYSALDSLGLHVYSVLDSTLLYILLINLVYPI